MQKLIRKTFTRQLDQTDCGVACLLSILHYYGGEATRERLRELSGTSIQHTEYSGQHRFHKFVVLPVHPVIVNHANPE